MDRVLDMTNSEIITKYKNGTSISILADLNACKTDVIKEIVGLTKPKPEKKIPVKQSHPSIMPKRTASEMHVLHCEMKKLYVKGGHDAEIAKKLNCSPAMVGEWRRKNDLPGNKQLKSGFNNSAKQRSAIESTDEPKPWVPDPMLVEENEALKRETGRWKASESGTHLIDTKPIAAEEVEAQPKPLTHILKCQQPYFDDIWEGYKPFEVRLNDREYEAGDSVLLMAYNAEHSIYETRQIFANIGYILSGKSFPALLNEEVVVFSLINIKRYELQEVNL